MLLKNTLGTLPDGRGSETALPVINNAFRAPTDSNSNGSDLHLDFS